MKPRSFKWGILGPGKIANKFAEDLQKVPGAEIYAVASRTESRAKEFAKKFNAPKSYGSYEDLVNDKEVEIIYIATPHVFHFEQTLLCLRKKKAVLCEKPFAMNASQVEQMIATAKENEVFLMEGMWTHFLPHYQFLMELVKTRKYGEILKLKADFGFAAPFLPEKRLYNKSLGGGSLLDIGIYPVFAALSLLGVPEEISANAEICGTGIDESCDIEFHYPNGVTAILNSTINKQTPTAATLELENARIIVKNRFHEPTSILIEQNGKKEEITFDVNTRGYDYEAFHVQQMLTEGRTESTVMTFQKSRELIGLLDKIREKIGLVY